MRASLKGGVVRPQLSGVCAGCTPVYLWGAPSSPASSAPLISTWLAASDGGWLLAAGGWRIQSMSEAISRSHLK
ncbi:unnamed protein product [Lota lota]